MHIVIAVITAVAGLIWALNSLQRSGVDLNAFSPFTWLRRRKWEKKLGTKPIHALKDSMEAAALLMVAVAKEEGDITRDSKMEILDMFEEAFGLSRSKAISLFSSCTFMLKDEVHIVGEVTKILAPSKDDFDQSHVEKLIGMLNKVAAKEGRPSEAQAEIIHAVAKSLQGSDYAAENW